MDVYWHSDHLVKADVGSTLVAVNDQLKKLNYKGATSEWIQKLRERDSAIETKNAKKMDEKPADGNINPLKLLGTLDKVSEIKLNISLLVFIRLSPKMQLWLRTVETLLVPPLILLDQRAHCNG